MVTPAMVLDFSRWKLQLPTGPKERPAEVTTAALQAGFEAPPWFEASPLGAGGVTFRAAVNGTTTSGSNYPRSELRELNPDGALASWSSSKGWHSLTVSLSFDELPLSKPHCVGAQIHDGKDDVTVWRLEGTKLWITRGDEKFKLVTDRYALGTRLEARYVVWQDRIDAYCDGRMVATIPAKFTGGYFKTGCYTQANCGNSTPCSDANRGAVTIHSTRIEHHDKPPVTKPAEPAPLPPIRPPVPTSYLVRHTYDGTRWTATVVD